MFHYSHENHLKLGLARIVRATRTEIAFVNQIGICTREPVSGLAESVRAARLIRESFGPRLVLCMSAGIDSQCMALAFIEAKIPFTVAIAKYTPGALNSDDIEGAVRFCELRDLKYEIFEIDLIDYFVKTENHLKLATECDCKSPQLAVHLELARRIDGIPIYAWNPTEIKIQQARAVVCLPSIPHSAYWLYFTRKRLPGVPYFFAYTAEQIYAFWRTPATIRQLRAIGECLALENSQARQSIEADLLNSENLYKGKLEKYAESGFVFEAAAEKKTGFEGAKIFFQDYFASLRKIPEGVRDSAFDHFFRRPMESLSPYPTQYVQIVSRDFFPVPELFQSLDQ